MSAHYRKIVCIVSIFLVFSMAGCLGGSKSATPTATKSNDAAYTQAAQTIVAELTQNATPANSLSMLASATAVSVQAQAKQETLPPTSTSLPTETLPPTSTPRPTNTPFPTDVPTEVVTEVPTATPEPVFQQVYQDDFTSMHAWKAGKDTSESFHFSNGGYVISSDVPNEIVWSVRTDSYNDVRIDVTASKVTGPLDGYYGVVCRFSNGGNYYVLAIGSDGWYGIGLKKSSLLHFLTEGVDTKNILGGNAKNKIRAYCVGDRLALYVNDVFIAQVKDSTFAGGATGMAVGTHQIAGYSALFDDYALYVPAQ